MTRPEDCAAAVLTGGRSRRMGRPKALLAWRGETFLTRLARELSGFRELLISSGARSGLTDDVLLRAVPDGQPARAVHDRYDGLGPLAGLHAALSAAQTPLLLCLPCDLPCFTGEAAVRLLSAFPPEAGALVCADSSGRIHPLCGVYARSVLPVLTRQLEAGRPRVLDFLDRIDCRLYRALPDSVLRNINTPIAFEHLTDVT